MTAVVFLAACVGGTAPVGASAETGITHPSMRSDGARPFYAYLKQGEYLYVKTDEATEYIRDQDGKEYDWSAAGKSYGPATADGVWQVYVPGGSNGLDGSWRLEARRGPSSDSVVEGRVWTHRYYMTQFGGEQPEFVDLRFWMLNDSGYLYDVRLKDYNGINSNIKASSVGNTRSSTDCASAYRSKDSFDGNALGCGDDYRIFFSEPAADLPETANQDGETVFVKPEPLTRADLEASSLTFSPSEESGFAGTFTTTITPRFQGNYELQIDIDGDGEFGGDRDQSHQLAATGSGKYQFDWDGKDSSGEAVIPPGTPLNARIHFDKLSEFHITQNDVEQRGGIRVVRVNGEQPGDATLHWDDRALSKKDRVVADHLDGRAGIDSSGYVHGWSYLDECTGAKEDCGSWGNNRSIDDWTFARVEGYSPTQAFGGRPGLSLEKRADHDTYREAGEEITYTFTATNTGNLDLTEVEVSEQDFSGSGELTPVSCPSSDLAVGESMTCTATYRVVQEDLDRGTVENAAVVSGTPPGGTEVVSPPGEETVRAVDEPGIALVKSITNRTAGDARPAPSTSFDLGHALDYTFVISNVGNLTLTNLKLQETEFSGAEKLGDVACLERELLPGKSTICQAKYPAATQADVDRGTIENTAVATAEAVRHPEVTSGPSSAIAAAPKRPALHLTKTADRTSFVSGDEITYTFAVKNAGNVTLTKVRVDERSFNGGGKLSEPVCGSGSLAPGDETVCTASYTATQADLDRGDLDNSAVATGEDPGGASVESPPSGVLIPGAQSPVLDLVKRVDRDRFTTGDPIGYSFEATNRGNVTLADVAVIERSFTGTGEIGEIECPQDTLLEPGASVTCVAEYRATQEDLDHGTIENTAAATARDPRGNPVESGPATAKTVGDQSPGLQLEKTVDRESFAPGDLLTYTFAVKNTGNTTVHGALVQEVRWSGSAQGGDISCPGGGGTVLAPGATLTCTSSYSATAEDQGAQETLVNVAVATGHTGTAEGPEVRSNEDQASSEPLPLPAAAPVPSGTDAVLAETGSGGGATPSIIGGAFIAAGACLLALVLLMRRRRAAGALERAHECRDPQDVVTGND